MTDTRVSPELLQQALNSSDESLIKFVLDNTKTEQIPDFIDNLSVSLIPTFLKTFNKFIISESDYLGTVIPWIDILVTTHQSSISASGECCKRLEDLQLTLKKRTEQIGMFIEMYSATEFVKNERDGKGVGLAIDDTNAQEIMEI